MIEIIMGSAVFTAVVVSLTSMVLAAKMILLPSHAVRVQINEEKTVDTTTGRKLLSVLTESGIPVPGTCGGVGTCGLCRVNVLSGGGEPLPAEQGKLSRQDLRDGLRLACQVTVRNDVAVEVPPELLHVITAECRVRHAKSVAPLIKEIAFDIPADTEFPLYPGAFIEIAVPRYQLNFTDIDIAPKHEPTWDRLGFRKFTSVSKAPTKRAYSIANRPADKGSVVLNIRLALPPPGTGAPPGVVSSYLFGLKAGEKVTINGPFGNFRVQDTDREMLFIGGGVGMAPLRALIFDQLEKVGTKRKITYWYGARSKIDLFYEDEFEDLESRFDNFKWTVALSEPQPEDGWTGPVGFVHTVVYETYLKNHPAPDECEYYLCGPPMMVLAVKTMLDRLGVDPDAIYYDDFGS